MHGCAPTEGRTPIKRFIIEPCFDIMKFHEYLSQALQYSLDLQGTVVGFKGSFDPRCLSKCDFLYLRLVAVSSRHHPLAGDEGSTAEVVASVQRHLVGDRVSGTLISSDDLVILGCSN